MRKVPFLTLEKAQEIAAKVPTPFHIYDEAGIRSTARALSQAFAWNPGFREYFAVKATPNPKLPGALLRQALERPCHLILRHAILGIPGHIHDGVA